MTDIAEQPVSRPTVRPVAAPAVDAPEPTSRVAAQVGGELSVPPAVRSVLAPLTAALRWCAVVLGTALAAPDAAEGAVGLVVANSICLYVTTWRTMRPLRLGSPERAHRIMAITDVALLGAAVGVDDGLGSPFVGCVIAAVAVASFGWGVRHGLLALAAGTVMAITSAVVTTEPTGLAGAVGWTVLAAAVAAVILLGWSRGRLLAAEARRVQIAGRLDALAETNELLFVLNRVARTLPSTLDLQQALGAARTQLSDTFQASTIGLLTRSEVDDTWAPVLADGLALPPAVASESLPAHLRSCLDTGGVVLATRLDGTGLDPDSGSGLYTPLRARGRIVGVLGVEHPTAGHYSERDGRLLAGLGEALALTLDNVRWFRRLRILGAEEERARIARDLHDRLGQWLTYISFELERIKGSPDVGDPAELDALHQDVQRAIDELRETLRQMRTSVTEDQSLTDVARDLCTRYARQSGLRIELDVDESGERFPVAVENELLRIMQEALNNVGKHANASTVTIDWIVEPSQARLRIRDDGDGFDSGRSVRDTAFGLVGMRERAEAIDAELVVTSSPGAGTTIDVTVPREDRP